jgi:hypothetical protein
MSRHFLICCSALALALLAAPSSHAQVVTGYGVNSAGTLFSFDVAAPANVTTHGAVGAVGFVPEGIDFRPGTSTLYAIDVGPNTTSLYTLNITSGASTLVGSFNSTGMDYDLTGNQDFGFDFNPKTLQGDDSMRIRLVATNNSNLRLNSSTGQIAGVDTDLAFANQNSPFVSAAAYINNAPANAGETQLFVMDTRNDAMLTLLGNPNAGVVSNVGDFGVGINAQGNISFDVYTQVGGDGGGVAGDVGYAVFQRPDAPINGPLGAYLLYSVNLSTGGTTGGALVGPAMTPFDFDGGFAVLPGPIPEPTSWALAAVACAVLVRRRSRA